MDYAIQKGQTTYPVSEEEVADWIRVHDYSDPGLRLVLMTATEAVQAYTRRAFLTQNFKIRFDGYPGVGTKTGGLDVLRTVPYDEISLPFAPLIEIDAVKVIHRDGSVDVVPSVNYRVNDMKEPGTIRLFNRPSVSDSDWLQIEYKSGFGDLPDDVPVSIRMGIMQTAGYLYEHRGDCEPESAILNSGAARTLQSWRIYEML